MFLVRRAINGNGWNCMSQKTLGNKFEFELLRIIGLLILYLLVRLQYVLNVNHTKCGFSNLIIQM